MAKITKLPTSIVKRRNGSHDLFLGTTKLYTFTSFAQAEAAEIGMNKHWELLLAENLVRETPVYGLPPQATKRKYLTPERGIRQLGHRWYVTSPTPIKGSFDTFEQAQEARNQLLLAHLPLTAKRPRKPRKPPTLTDPSTHQ